MKRSSVRVLRRLSRRACWPSAASTRPHRSDSALSWSWPPCISTWHSATQRALPGAPASSSTCAPSPASGPRQRSLPEQAKTNRQAGALLADRVAELDGAITGDPIKLVELSRLDRFELPADTAVPAAITDNTLERMRGLIGAYAEALDRTRGADELTHHLLLKLVRRQVETEAELEGLATPRGRQLYTIAREVVVEIEAEWTSRLGKAKMRQLRELLEELNAAL
jgi:ferritin-like protein